jgi:hypothetical protein
LRRACRHSLHSGIPASLRGSFQSSRMSHGGPIPAWPSRPLAHTTTPALCDCEWPACHRRHAHGARLLDRKTGGHRGTERCGISGSLHLDVSSPHHLAPLLGFVSNELSQIRRRKTRHQPCASCWARFSRRSRRRHAARSAGKGSLARHPLTLLQVKALLGHATRHDALGQLSAHVLRRCPRHLGFRYFSAALLQSEFIRRPVWSPVGVGCSAQPTRSAATTDGRRLFVSQTRPIGPLVGGGDEPYILWRRPSERRPARNAVSRRRDTVPCMHSGESGKCGQHAL